MSQKDFHTCVTTWVSDMNQKYGTDLTKDEPQAKFSGDNGVDILISPAIQEEALFFTAVFRFESSVNPHINLMILKMNFLLRESLGGWFCIDPVDNLVCWQYLWKDFKISQFGGFIIVFEHLISAVEEINEKIKLATSADLLDIPASTGSLITFKP